MTYNHKLVAMFSSRRFQSAVMAIGVITFQELIGLNYDQAIVIVGIIATWILGDSITKTR